MQRRELLKGIAALPLAGLCAPLSAHPPFGRVRPKDPDWPASQQWHKLSASVGGTLLPVHALFDSCSQPASPACHEIIENIHNPFYLGDQAAGTQVSGWLDAWTPAASVYAVRARNSADVAAAVNFAREHRLRLVVKGGGHSYQGTSNAADSLLIWTRAMNEVTLHEAFVARGCEGKMSPLPAVSSGAGAMWIDLYHAVTAGAGPEEDLAALFMRSCMVYAGAPDALRQWAAQMKLPDARCFLFSNRIMARGQPSPARLSPVREANKRESRI